MKLAVSLLSDWSMTSKRHQGLVGCCCYFDLPDREDMISSGRTGKVPHIPPTRSLLEIKWYMERKWQLSIMHTNAVYRKFRFSATSLRRHCAIQMCLFQRVCFFISIFPVPTNSSEQINGYETAIVKSIPSSKCEFFLSVFVASHPKHPQGKHSWTETS